MAPAFRSSATKKYGSTTNTTVTKPTGTADGDFLIAFFVSARAGDVDPLVPSTPAGWTLAATFTDLEDPAHFTARNFIYTKIASGEGASWAWNHAATSTECTVLAITGADTTTPIAVTLPSALNTSGVGTASTNNATSITTPGNDCMVIWYGQDWGSTANTLTAPAGSTPTFTQRVTCTVSSLQSIATGVLITAGATGTKTQTCNCNATTDQRGAVLVAIQPPSAGGTTLTADAGSYALTGTSAGLAGKAVASAGSYTITGTSATLAGKALAAGGSYTLTGTAAGLHQTLAAAVGGYTLTGSPASINVGGNVGLPAAAGSYTLTGSDATFAIASGSFTLFCDAGAYMLSGSEALFPGYDTQPPVQPSIEGSGYAGAWSGPKRRKRKRDEIEELIELVQSAPPQIPPQTPQIPQPPPPALIDMTAKMQAVGLTPPQRRTVKRAIVTDDPDDDEEAIELLLNLLS